jgi:prepilin-type N-terminal cleavage/methylation domain-containing protein
MRRFRPASQRGFTLIEMMVSVVLAGVMATALFRLWGDNQSATLRIGNKSDYRDKATLATNALNRSITMAGFGMSNLDVIVRKQGDSSDTLILYRNPDERRTTLMDTARVGSTSILVFNDTGFYEGGMFGITDSLKQEFAHITTISGDSASGFVLHLSTPLQHRYDPGVPDIYPAVKEKFYIEYESKDLINVSEGETAILAHDMFEFRIDLKNAAGSPASSYKTIRVVTFALAGKYKAPEGTYNQMRFSSTVIPRNIL